MAKRTTKKNTAETNNVTDYRHSSKRKNIPEAGIAAQGRIAEVIGATEMKR